MSVILVCLCLMPNGGADDVQTIRQGHFDFNDLAPIGMVFESYDWFQSFTWTPVQVDGHRFVDFAGVIPADAAYRDFQERNRYKLRLGLKTMQLEPYYQLPEKRSMLRFVIRFKLDGQGGFAVHAGWLGVQAEAGGEWRRNALENKALAAIVRGIFANKDPFASLVDGLPYK